MRNIKMNIRLVTFLAAAVVAVVAAGSLAPEARQAYAADITDPTGVFCADITVTLGETEIDGIILARFEYVMGFDFDPDVDGDQDTAITAAAYAPEGKPADPGPADPGATCQEPQSELVNVTFAAQSAARPSLTGIWEETTADTIEGSTCAEDVEFGGITFQGFTKITVDFNLKPLTDGKSVDSNAFSFDNAPYTDDTCTTPTGETGLGTIVVGVSGKFLDGPDAAKATFDSDWDKDGCLDWDELDPDPKLPPFDPFNPSDCPGVGGIAELPAAAGAALEAGSSASDAGVIAAAAAAAAAGALALGSVAAYARRRSVR